MQNPQEQICNAAGRLFLKYGIRAVSVDDICRELRISKKTFYQHFTSKEDLILSLLDVFEVERKRFFSGIMDGKNAIELLIALSKEVRKNLDADTELVKKDLEKYYPDIYKTIKEKHNSLAVEFVKQNLEQGIEEGLYREDLDIDFVAICYNTQLRSAYEELLKFDRKKYPKKKIMDLFFDLYFRVVVNEKGMEYYQKNYSSDIKI